MARHPVTAMYGTPFLWLVAKAVFLGAGSGKYSDGLRLGEMV